ncbi:sphingosine 1-phosphate receptor 1 [Synchiropus splendidus]|uniref:sphingosine 1-phosphate receptor 1 n=1 Tax=Synchiropus splendidus TaxID=270530 RepID=UPI00237E72E2|nr:sphingosine 1-phosphate receptor 1 [Synchiropus splendidus]XP_053710372.1 sphingosine 1-phosphate receptor 1 [Synchiropus splendidus]
MAESTYSDLIAKHYNYTGKYRKTDPDAGLKADSVIFIIVCCFIILENILVLTTIWRTKKFHKPMYYFIGNLALSDLLAGVVYTANILLSGANTYKLTPTQWFFREGSMFVALAASVFSLLAIAIERHLTMLKMKLHNNGNTFRVFLLISTVWMIAAVLGGLPVMGWNCIQSLSRCSTVLPLYHKTYILFCTTVFSILLMAIVALYARIYVLVRTRSRKLSFRKVTNGRNANANSKSSEKSMALLKTVIIVLSCFIACWAPLFILLLLDASCETLACPILYKAEWFLALAVLNSAMNPLIYTLTSNEMRRAFLKTLLCCTSCLRPKAKFSGPIMGAEFSRSKSDNSSHPNKEEPEYSPRETTVVSSANITSSS